MNEQFPRPEQCLGSQGRRPGSLGAEQPEWIEEDVRRGPRSSGTSTCGWFKESGRAIDSVPVSTS